MNAGVRLVEDFGETWREQGKDENGRYAERMKDDEAEETFWRNYVEKLGEGRPRKDEYAKGLQPALLRHIQQGDHVLEIGPGWGNYTASLAEKASVLTCVDASRAILDYLQGLKELRERDVRFVHGKWETCEASDYYKKYDVALGVNCFYRMLDIESAMLNLNQAARRRAVIGLTSGPERPHLIELARDSRYRVRLARRDYIQLVNLLYQLGIDASVDIVPLSRTYVYDSEEQMLRENLNKVECLEADRSYAERVLRRYVEPGEGEKWLYRHRFKAALIHWEPVEEDERLRTGREIRSTIRSN